jgi:hypothetical protein
MDANADRSRERPRECRLFQAHVVFDGHRAGNLAIGRMMFFIVFPWIGNEELQCDQTVSGAPVERLFAGERRLRATRGI